MGFAKFSTAILASLVAGGPVTAAASEACEPMSHVVKLARNDFTALRSLKMQPGVCTLRPAEYRCRWAFPGDSFAVAEAQANMMVQCAAGETAAPLRTLKRGESAIALEPDLWLVIPRPKIDSGQWVVLMRIAEGPAPVR